MEIRQVAGDGDAGEVVERLTEEIREVDRTHQAVRLPHEHGRATLVVPVHTRLAGSGVIVVDQAEETPSLRGIMLDLVAVTAVQVALILDRDQALRDRAQPARRQGPRPDRPRPPRPRHPAALRHRHAACRAPGGWTSPLCAPASTTPSPTSTSPSRSLRAAIFEPGHRQRPSAARRGAHPAGGVLRAARLPAAAARRRAGRSGARPRGGHPRAADPARGAVQRRAARPRRVRDRRA
ncbi:hypothetical protein [Nocardioides convexus]|uniref:hypothetical protein n=1 Tax=Nocardioides convexus TaxID=2712224 RepID=UPI003101334F